MLTTKDFSRLPKNEQVYKLFNEGKELLTRKDSMFIVKLFSIDDLYVEIWYNAEKNFIDNIKVVSEQDLVKIYEKEIKLSSLIRK